MYFLRTSFAVNAILQMRGEEASQASRPHARAAQLAPGGRGEERAHCGRPPPPRTTKLHGKARPAAAPCRTKARTASMTTTTTDPPVTPRALPSVRCILVYMSLLLLLLRRPIPVDIGDKYCW